MATRLWCVYTQGKTSSLHMRRSPGCAAGFGNNMHGSRQHTLVCEITTNEQPARTSWPRKTLEQRAYQQIRWKGNRGVVNGAPRGHKWSKRADSVHKRSNHSVFNGATASWAFWFPPFFFFSPFFCFSAVFVHSGSSFQRAWPLDSDRPARSLGTVTNKKQLSHREVRLGPARWACSCWGWAARLGWSRWRSRPGNRRKSRKTAEFWLWMKMGGEKKKQNKTKVSATLLRRWLDVGIWHSHVKHVHLQLK